VGLFNRIKDPVSGTARVVWARAASGSKTEAQLSITAIGVDPFEAMYTFEAPKGKAAIPGASLPVTFDSERHDRLRIEWSDVPESSAGASAAPVSPTPATPPGVPPEAAGVLETFRKSFPGGSVSFQTQVIDGRNQPELLKPFEDMTGMDLDGDGKVGSGPGTLAAPGGAGGWQVAASTGGAADTITRLERLARLHESGALSDAEFAAEKAKVLGSDAES
jgi:hypothetical protein